MVLRISALEPHCRALPVAFQTQGSLCPRQTSQPASGLNGIAVSLDDYAHTIICQGHTQRHHHPWTMSMVKALQISQRSFWCRWADHGDETCYLTQTRNIKRANGTWLLTNKSPSPRQWLFLHFHKHSHYFFYFYKFAQCVYLLHFDMPIQINLIFFFVSRKLLRNPRA